MPAKSRFAISMNKAQREGFGLRALSYLEDLVAHDEVCTDLDSRLCLGHVEISRKFNDEVRWMKGCADTLAFEESLPEKR